MTPMTKTSTLSTPVSAERRDPKLSAAPQAIDATQFGKIVGGFSPKGTWSPASKTTTVK
jgi:hypothetical protein